MMLEELDENLSQVEVYENNYLVGGTSGREHHSGVRYELRRTGYFVW
jgi:hypothetical protein